MTVSSHLTPEPERRLWLILADMRAASAAADRRVFALTALAVAEVAAAAMGPAGPARTAALLALGAAPILGVFAFSPLDQGWWPLRRPRAERRRGDCLIAAEDLAQYAQGELIGPLERYLGGGITGTTYHEDLVGQIAAQARVAARKGRLLRMHCVLVGIGQLAFLAALLAR